MKINNNTTFEEIKTALIADKFAEILTGNWSNEAVDIDKVARVTYLDAVYERAKFYFNEYLAINATPEIIDRKHELEDFSYDAHGEEIDDLETIEKAAKRLGYNSAECYIELTEANLEEEVA